MASIETAQTASGAVIQCGAPVVSGFRADGPLGRELVLSLVPAAVCSYDCRYCPTQAAKRQVVERSQFRPVTEVLEAVDDWVGANGAPDGIWYECGGEPTLYRGLGMLTCCLRQAMPSVRIGVRSNGSLLADDAVRRELGLCNLVRIRLDAGNDDVFRRVNRPHRGVVLDQVVAGLLRFRKSYFGTLWVETAFARGINDSEINLVGLANLLLDIRPDRYLVRPVCGGSGDGRLLAPGADFLEAAARLLEAAPFPVSFEVA